MSIRDELQAATAEFALLSIYQRFEHGVILVLTALIAVVAVAAVWSLILKVLFGLPFSGVLDPSDYPVAAILALAVVYWPARDRDQPRMQAGSRHAPPTPAEYSVSGVEAASADASDALATPTSAGRSSRS
jgi:hypothetical protein